MENENKVPYPVLAAVLEDYELFHNDNDSSELMANIANMN
jgi:hypothetical protein